MLAKKEEYASFSFRQIFFKCCLSENKFSPFWVYRQWYKLNLVIYSQPMAGEIMSHNTAKP